MDEVNKKVYAVALFATVMTLIVGLAIALCSIAVYDNTAYAEVEHTTKAVRATYAYSKISDTECEVSIQNRSEATFAHIPSTAEIDNVKYTVSRISANGFSSSIKLERVSLPHSIKQIGASAFNNCPLLNSVSLASVNEIDNNAFSRCNSLKEIIIPKSVKSIGNTIFRTNSTQVYARASSPSENWSATWNGSNKIANVIFDSDIVADLIFEEVYVANSSVARMTNETEIIGYEVAEGQPFADEFYVGEDIIIPAEKDNKPVINIVDYAFDSCTFKKCIIEYSELPINIGNEAFYQVDGSDLVVNRDVTFNSEDGDGGESMNIFYESTLNTVALPNTLTSIPSGMFFGCSELSDIIFFSPIKVGFDFDEFMNNAVLDGKVFIPNKGDFAIKAKAFLGTGALKELHITDNVMVVGSMIVDNGDFEMIYLDYVYNNLPMGFANDWCGNFDKTRIEYTKYTVYFNADGGVIDGASSKIVKTGGVIGDLPAVSRSGAVFGGWYTLKSGNGVEYSSASSFDIKNDLILYAKWLIEITFNSNGGSRCDVITVTAGKSVALPIPILNGKTGKWRSSSGTEYNYGGVYVFNSSTALTAEWRYKTFDESRNSSGEYEIWFDSQFRYISEHATENIKFRLMDSFYLRNWAGIPIFNGVIYGNNMIIEYNNSSVYYGRNYGFIIENNGTISDLTVFPDLTLSNGSGNGSLVGIGGVVGVNKGTVSNVTVRSYISNPSMSSSGTPNTDLKFNAGMAHHVGGIVGHNYGVVKNCTNYASIGGGVNMAGIVSLNFERAQVTSCRNYGNIYFNHSTAASITIAGIVGTVRDGGYVNDCANYATVKWAAKINSATYSQPIIGKYIGGMCVSATCQNLVGYGSVVVDFDVKISLRDSQLLYVKDEAIAYKFPVPKN